MRIGIGLKLGLWLAMLGTLSTGLTGYYVYQRSRTLLVAASQDKLLTATQALANRFADALAATAADVDFLTALSINAEIANVTADTHQHALRKQSLAALFTSLLQAHPEYSQIRLIDAQHYGKELVRVDRDRDDIKTIADDQLREKNHFPYVFETLRLPAGQFYVSEINLNQELGTHLGFGKPTVRVAAPIKSKATGNIALIVINVDLDGLFAQISQDIAGDAHLLVSNDRGDYLIHPDSAKTFGFERGRPFLIQDDIDATRPILENRQDQAVFVGSDSKILEEPFLAAFVKRSFGPENSPRFLLLGLYTPLENVLRESQALGRQVIHITLLFSLLASVISLLLARVLAKPLQTMTQAIGRFELGRPLPSMPTQRNDEIGYLATSFLSMTEQLNAQVAVLFASETKLHAILDNAPVGIWLTGIDGRYLFVNNTFCEALGIGESRFLAGEPLDALLGSDSAQRFLEADRACLNMSVTTHQCHETLTFGDGEQHIVEITRTPLHDMDGKAIGVIGIAMDITQKKHSEQLIWVQANFDPLTNLPNRRMFHDRLDQEIKKSHRTGLPLALIFLDLDRFKEVNDSLGHDMGDLLLKDAARRLSGCVRESDTVARLGGDEFTLILSELDEQSDVERIVQNILGKLSEPFQLKNRLVYVSASIGITLYPKDGDDIDTLIKNADQSMYAAKHQGRNRYSYFTSSMQAAALARMQTASDLRAALASGQLRLYYQPVVDLSTGKVCKAEALLRWQHPDKGMLGPDAFITIAEDVGIINDIGDWVFHEAAKHARHWRRHYNPDLQIGVNKSPAQFHNSDSIHQTWMDHLQQLGLSGQAIVVEITEGLLLDANERVTNQLTAFRDAGMQVSLDDFGTGYSSLAYLKKFHIDYIKIDRTFVSHLAPTVSDMALCEAIIVMAHKLGMKVIAEGIETEEQRDLLIAAGCDYGQGYLFAKPLSPAEFERFLDGKHAL